MYGHVESRPVGACLTAGYDFFDHGVSPPLACKR
jgi:hypothetical protein